MERVTQAVAVAVAVLSEAAVPAVLWGGVKVGEATGEEATVKARWVAGVAGWAAKRCRVGTAAARAVGRRAAGQREG